MAKIDDINKLPAGEKIKRLKELEKKRRKEIQEAQKLIRQSEDQLEEEKKIMERIPIPELKAVDVGALFGETDKEMFRMKRFVSDAKTVTEEEKKPVKKLEEAVAEAPKLTPDQEAANLQYAIDTMGKEWSAAKLDYEANKLQYDINKQGGQANGYQQHKAYMIDKARQEKWDAVKSGEYRPDEYAKKKLDHLDDISSSLVMTYRRAS